MKSSVAHRSNTVPDQPGSYQHRASMYALAAGAAGIGILALAPSTQAKVVYRSAHLRIPHSGIPVDLDLNHDKSIDFDFTNEVFGRDAASPALGSGPTTYVLRAAPAQPSNRVLAIQTSTCLCAARLHKGARIGAAGNFQPGSSRLILALKRITSGVTSYGPWLGTHTGYLGLKFVIRGKTHFGWARLHVVNSFTATVTGYAYETIPNKHIVAGDTGNTDQTTSVEQQSALPEPVTLGMLALGKSLRSVRRRAEVDSPSTSN